jgi:hypothetical protein
VLKAAFLTLVLAATAGALGATGASFSGKTQNSSNSFAAAASFCSGGTQTASADADSWVDQLLSVVNFGTDTSLNVQSMLGDNRRLLVHFALPSLPSYCSVTAATLKLFATSAASGRTLQAFRAASSWTETGVTWSNQPTTTGSASTAPSGTGFLSWNVLSQVQAFYSGSNFGFVVKDASESAAVAASEAFSSREAASNPPQLVLTFG